jgi:hypothetical protein
MLFFADLFELISSTIKKKKKISLIMGSSEGRFRSRGKRKFAGKKCEI